MQICNDTEAEIAVINYYQPLSGLYKPYNNFQEHSYFAYINERKETVKEKFNMFYTTTLLLLVWTST